LLTKQHTRGDYRTVEEQPRPALASTAGREEVRQLAAEPSRSRFNAATGILAAAPRISQRADSRTLAICAGIERHVGCACGGGCRTKIGVPGLIDAGVE
jgi:hypothetical protein